MPKTKQKVVDMSEPIQEAKMSAEEGVKTEETSVEQAQPEQPNEESAPKEKKAKVSKRAKAKQNPPKARSKKYQEANSQVDHQQKYSLNEAVELAQKVSYTKFKGSVEAHINTAQKGMRGLISLPFASGKKLTILAFGKGAKEAGTDLVGDESTIDDIKAGKVNFDVLVSTPEWMPKLASAAKVLGPRGLMPNPKSGTVTDDLEKTISDLQAGKMEYKTEPNGMVIHLSVGKADQNPEEVAANIRVLYNTLGKSRVKKITLAPTMGPGVKVNLSSI